MSCLGKSFLNHLGNYQECALDPNDIVMGSADQTCHAVLYGQAHGKKQQERDKGRII